MSAVDTPLRHPSSQKLWGWIGAALLIGGALFLLLSLFSYETLRAMGDVLSKDGSLDSLTRAVFPTVQAILRLVGAITLLSGGLWWGLRRRSMRALDSLLVGGIAALKGLPSDASILFRDAWAGTGRLEYRIAILVLTIFGIIEAILFLWQPMGYDESYTVLVFASRPLRYAISDYHLPNNHLFHTLLVHLAYHGLGQGPWAVRLPALLASVLSVPALYLVGAQLYSRNAALFAAGMLAASGAWLEYATNARGYSLLTLFSLLTAGLGIYLTRRQNRFAWLLFTLFGALGFYTLPIMLYPFGAIMTWMLASALVGEHPYGSLRSYLLRWFAAGIGAGFLAALLHLPVVQASGLNALIANNFVAAQPSAEAWENLVVRLQNTWKWWMREWPTGAGVVVGGSALASIILHPWMSKRRVPLLISAAWIIVVLAIQRVAPLPRIWLFALPFILLASAASFTFLVRLLYRLIAGSNEPLHNAAGDQLFVAVPVLFSLALGAFMLRAHSQTFFPNRANIGEAEAITRFLQGEIDPSDRVAAISPVNFPLWYYAELYGLPPGTSCRGGCKGDFQRILLVVGARSGQTPEQVLAWFGLPEGWASLATEIYSYGSYQVYAIQADPLP